jgi:hypothetical protein
MAAPFKWRSGTLSCAIAMLIAAMRVKRPHFLEASSDAATSCASGATEVSGPIHEEHNPRTRQNLLEMYRKSAVVLALY